MNQILPWSGEPRTNILKPCCLKLGSLSKNKKKLNSFFFKMSDTFIVQDKWKEIFLMIFFQKKSKSNRNELNRNELCWIILKELEKVEKLNVMAKMNHFNKKNPHAASNFCIMSNISKHFYFFSKLNFSMTFYQNCSLIVPPRCEQQCLYIFRSRMWA